MDTANPLLDVNEVTLFKALGDDIRWTVMSLVYLHQELCVCQIVDTLKAPQSKISRHLGVLRDAGLLVPRREGKWIYYRCHPELPAWLLMALKEAPAAAANIVAPIPATACR